jgi:DEAD/DEAH box helicase domain-containing protein
MSKTGAYIIISTLLNLELNLPEISLEEQETCHAGVETVVFAEEVRPKHGVKIEIIT